MSGFGSTPFKYGYLNGTSPSGACRNGSTCVDLVEDCKKATSIHFFVSQESQEKQNGYNNMYSTCSIALII